jgi:flagellar FliJ protein
MIAARAEMEKRRSEYMEAHRRLEVVNRLETKARTVYRLASQREEQVEFDELAGRSHAARQPRFAL